MALGVVGSGATTTGASGWLSASPREDDAVKENGEKLPTIERERERERELKKLQTINLQEIN